MIIWHGMSSCSVLKRYCGSVLYSRMEVTMAKTFQFDYNVAVAETTKGKVRGYYYNDMYIFKGIPYAKAKRFHAPEPVEAWEGVMDTNSFGHVCPLLEMPKPNGEVAVPHRYWIMNEDCQNLNIWTTALDGSKRPVMVWLHGGGYEAGSAIEHIAYEGENMCKYGDVVVVSINHRLNVLGYCDLSVFGEEYANSGNAGTDDIIAALIWIRDNITNFGGDPDNVTLFGQSGGGAKITTLLQTPAADGLFAKGINMSGVVGPILPDAKESGEELVRAMMAELKIETVKELEEISYDALAKAYLKVRPELEKAGKYVGGRPYQNAYYLGEPVTNGFRKETAHIPLMVGTVFGEFTSFGPTTYDKRSMSVQDGRDKVAEMLGEDAAAELLPLFEAAYPERNPVDLLTLDMMFRAPAMEYIKCRSDLNDCTYSYFFNQDMPLEGGRTPWHCADIPFVFHNTELVPYTQMDDVTETLESQIFESVMAFARTGNPNHDGIPAWPASTPEEEQVLIFDSNTRLVCNHDKELMPALVKYVGSIFMKEFMENAEDIQY